MLRYKCQENGLSQLITEARSKTDVRSESLHPAHALEDFCL